MFNENDPNKMMMRLKEVLLNDLRWRLFEFITNLRTILTPDLRYVQCWKNIFYHCGTL